MIRKRRLDYESPSVPTHQSYKQLPHDQKSMDYHSFIVKRQTILVMQREEITRTKDNAIRSCTPCDSAQALFVSLSVQINDIASSTMPSVQDGRLHLVSYLSVLNPSVHPSPCRPLNLTS